MSDLLMHVGVESYPWPHNFSDEVYNMGLSKRVPEGALPFITPGATRLACIHPKAIVEVTAERMQLFDLCMELAREHVEPPEDPRPPVHEHFYESYVYENLIFVAEGGDDDGAEYQSLGIHRLLEKAYLASDLERLEEKYGLEYRPGVFGFTYLTGMIKVASEKGTEQLSQEEQMLGVELVKVVYEEDGHEDQDE